MAIDPMIRKGFSDSLPVVVSFLFLFAGVGALYRDQGIGLAETLVGSALIFAAPLQVSALGAITNRELGAALALTMMVNFRFFLMSIVMSQYFEGIRKAKIFLAMVMFSASTYTVAHANIVAKGIKDGKSQFSYYLGVAYPSYLVAVLSTLLGYLLASYVDYSLLAGTIVMILPIHFTALTAKQSGNRLVVFATFLGGVLAPLLQEIGNEWLNIAVALAVGTIIALAQHQQQQQPAGSEK